MKITNLVWGGAILVILAMTAPSPVRAQGDGAIDNAALASSYQAEAKDAQAKAERHELMLKRYERMPVTPKGSAMPKEAMVAHCKKLVDSYKQAAAQASDLAKAHQEAASATK